MCQIFLACLLCQMIGAECGPIGAAPPALPPLGDTVWAMLGLWRSPPPSSTLSSLPWMINSKRGPLPTLETFLAAFLSSVKWRLLSKAYP